MTLRSIFKNRGGLIAEFVLVVAGVLVALAVDTAIEDRRDKQLRDKYIERIQADVEEDRQALEHRIEFFSDVQGFTEQFIDWLNSDDPVSNEVVLAAFYAAEVWPFIVKGHTYQDLLSTGNIRLIDDINLRTSLASYHNRANTAQSGWTPTETYRQTIRGVIPIRIQETIRSKCPTLTALTGEPTGFPPCELGAVNYEELEKKFAALKGDREFLRWLTYRHSELGVVIYLLGQQLAAAEELFDRTLVNDRLSRE